jgi:hydrogenase nickel incorporation protein HypA/HybF
MHELSVCLALMQQVERVCREHSARRVEMIRLQVGPLSGVEPPLLERAFPLASAGTVAEGAVLKIESCPVRVICSQCAAETEVPPNRLLCGECGDYRTRLVSGDEMLLASLELYRDDQPAGSGQGPSPPGPTRDGAGP